jgi:hydroxyacylglutathione hydrolase
MKQLYDDLWQTSAEHPLAQFPNSKCHAYLLRRDGGNVLFYSTGREARASQ